MMHVRYDFVKFCAHLTNNLYSCIRLEGTFQSMQKQNVGKKEPTMLSIGRASEYLGVSIDTLRRWEKRERIEAYRSPGGHRYFKKQDLDNLFGTKYQRDPSEEVETDKTVAAPLEIQKEEPAKKEVYKTVIVVAKRPLPIYEQVAQILDRPIRQFSIPPVKSLAIRSERFEVSTFNATSNSASDNTLLPQITLNNGPINASLSPTSEIRPQDRSSDETTLPPLPTKTKSLVSKTSIMVALAIVSVIIICLALVLYFYSQPKIISSIPSQY